MKCRKQLLESLGYWPSGSITEERVSWCSCPDTPSEVVRLVQGLMLRYEDVTKAFPEILKKVPGGVQVKGWERYGALCFMLLKAF